VPLSPEVAESQWDGGGTVQIAPVWFHAFSVLFIPCFLTRKELDVDIAAKELMSHKVCNLISPSAPFIFFPDTRVCAFPPALPLLRWRGRMCCAFKKGGFSED